MTLNKNDFSSHLTISNQKAESDMSIGSFWAPAEEWENKSMIVKDDNQFWETQDFTQRSRDEHNGNSIPSTYNYPIHHQLLYIQMITYVIY